MHESTATNTRVEIGGSSFVLSPTHDIEDLCTQLDAAASSNGSMVTFMTLGHGQVRALITPHSHVIITQELVALDMASALVPAGSSENWDLL